MKIIMDTNTLMAVSQFKIDIFSQLQGHRLFILQGTLDELHTINKEQKGKHKVAAQIALQLLSTKKVDILSSEGHVDDALVEYSKKGYRVLTQDIRLKRRLEKPYYTIRQTKYVVEVT